MCPCLIAFHVADNTQRRRSASWLDAMSALMRSPETTPQRAQRIQRRSESAPQRRPAAAPQRRSVGIRTRTQAAQAPRHPHQATRHRRRRHRTINQRHGPSNQLHPAMPCWRSVRRPGLCSRPASLPIHYTKGAACECQGNQLMGQPSHGSTARLEQEAHRMGPTIAWNSWPIFATHCFAASAVTFLSHVQTP